MCYKRHKEAPSTSYPAVIISRGLGVFGMTKNYNSTYQWLPLGFLQRWFLPFQLIFFLMFLPLLSPIHSNFFNLWKWNTAWLTSCEDLPTPTLTHKCLLSSQHFGRRPSVFIVHSSFWRVELALLFIVLLERFSSVCLEVKRVFWIFCVVCERKSALRSVTLSGNFTEEVFDSGYECSPVLVCVQCWQWGWPLVLVNDGWASQLPLDHLFHQHCSHWCHRTNLTTNLCVRKCQTVPSQKVKVVWLSL